MNQATLPLLALVFLAGVISGLIRPQSIHRRRLVGATLGGLVLMWLARSAPLPRSLLTVSPAWHWPAFVSASFAAAALALTIAVIRWSRLSYRLSVAFTIFLGATHVLTNVIGNDIGNDALVAVVEGAGVMLACSLGILAGGAIQHRSHAT